MKVETIIVDSTGAMLVESPGTVQTIVVTA
jgi:hypothetical protein